MTELARTPRLTRVLCLAAGLTVSATGAVLAAGSAASAEPLQENPLAPVTRAADTAAGALLAAVNPNLDLPLDPLAGTGSDPLANSVGTQIADFRPISTADLTGPITDGATSRELLGGLPLVGELV
ncbi:hypothetical protein [Streptomyces sp. NPDC127098]|uniref:hypothetical protein n=1 Tax=Streptomyces sp. NPDC127098 TaxID=3347137 RepID=UPI00364E12B3